MKTGKAVHHLFKEFFAHDFVACYVGQTDQESPFILDLCAGKYSYSLMSPDLPAWTAFLLPATVALLVLLFAVERIWPKAPAPPEIGRRFGGWRRLMRNGGLWAVNAGLISPFIVLPVSFAASAFALSLDGHWRPDLIPLAHDSGWGLLFDLLLLDLWIYWWHRANHSLPFLWRFHEVHHLDRMLDTTSSVRFHFVELLLSALVRVPVIVIFAVDPLSIFVFSLLVLAAAGFQHSNIRLPDGLERALSRLIITPSIHWVHHHRVRPDTDSNYGTVLSVWDRLFGSRSATERTPEMEIGTEGREEKNLTALLIDPLGLSISRSQRSAPAETE